MLVKTLYTLAAIIFCAGFASAQADPLVPERKIDWFNERAAADTTMTTLEAVTVSDVHYRASITLVSTASHFVVVPSARGTTQSPFVPSPDDGSNYDVGSTHVVTWPAQVGVSYALQMTEACTINIVVEKVKAVVAIAGRQSGSSSGGLSTVSTQGTRVVGDGSVGDPVDLGTASNVRSYLNVGDGADITAVVAGAGLTGGATSDSATLDVGAGTGITVNANDVALDLAASLAYTGSASTTGAGTRVQEGFKRRVYTYTGSVGNPTVLTEAQSGSVVSNAGAGSSLPAYVTLPTLTTTSQIGLTYTFVVEDADGIRVIAGTSDTIQVSTLTSASTGFFGSLTPGSSITVVATSTSTWVATVVTGVWVKDAMS